MIPNGEVDPPHQDVYAGRGMPNVVRAMSLVPDEVKHSIFELLSTHYLDLGSKMPGATESGRALSAPQIELIASRVSALNECFY